MADPSIRPNAIRRGRAIGIALFAALVTTFTAVCAVQIIWQAWHPAGALPAGECRTGIRQLISAIHRAREAASRVTGGEQEELTQFRAALEPEWSTRPSLTDRCAGDTEALAALGEVDRLRYAEEHALRYEALDVANRRRRVEAIERRLLESP